MKKTNGVCPRCGESITGYPALSRRDNKTYICSKCGNEEAMMDFTISERNGLRVVNHPLWVEIMFLRKLLVEAQVK